MILVLAALFLLPRPPWGNPHYGEILLAAIAVVRWRELLAAWSSLPRAAHILLLLLCATTAAALLAGRVDPASSALVLLRIGEALLVLALARRDTSPPERVARAVAACAAAAAVIGIGEVLLTPPPLIARAFESFSYGEANHFAALLALALAFLFRERPAAAPLLALALFATGSRTALLAAGAGMLACGATAAGANRRTVLAVGAGLLAFLALAVLAPGDLLSRPLFSQTDLAASPHAPRWQTWRLLLPPDGPVSLLFGRGAGAFPHRLYEGEWVHLFVEGGLAALLAAFVLWTAFLREAPRARPLLYTFLFLSLGMNTLLATRLALGGAILVGLSARPD